MSNNGTTTTSLVLTDATVSISGMAAVLVALEFVFPGLVSVVVDLNMVLVIVVGCIILNGFFGTASQPLLPTQRRVVFGYGFAALLLLAGHFALQGGFNLLRLSTIIGMTVLLLFFIKSLLTHDRRRNH